MKFLLADDHRLILDGLEQIIRDEFVSALIDKVTTKFDLFTKIGKSNYDILFLDLNMNGVNMLDHIEELVKIRPNTKIIILTSYDDRNLLNEAIEKNVNGFLMKNTSKAELVYAVTQVLEDKIYTNQNSDLSFNKKKLEDSFQKRSLLTKREIDVVRLISKGYNNSKIAKELFISIHTIQTHRKSIFKKLGVHSVSELISFVYRSNLI